MKNQVTFNPPDNPKRGKAKLERNKGKLAMEKAGVDQKQWARKFDPLYKVKGKERWRAIHESSN